MIEWRCPGCDTVVLTLNSATCADAAAREAGVHPECEEQMVRNIMAE